MSIGFLWGRQRGPAGGDGALLFCPPSPGSWMPCGGRMVENPVTPGCMWQVSSIQLPMPLPVPLTPHPLTSPPHPPPDPITCHCSFLPSRWAVSSVMTRQNQIPTEDGSRVTLALIPLWDMCNHTNGLVRSCPGCPHGWGGHRSHLPHYLGSSLPPTSRALRGQPTESHAHL